MKEKRIYLQEQRIVDDVLFCKLQKLLELNFEEIDIAARNKKLFDENKVVFVGQMHLRDDECEYLLFCYPKYVSLTCDLHQRIYDNKSNLAGIERDSIQHVHKVLIQISDVIGRAWHSKRQNFSEFSIANKKYKRRVIKSSIAKFILEDFKRNGIYYFEKEINAQEPIGKIDWGKTVHKCQPFISQNRPYYTNPFRKRIVADEDGTIVKIYQKALWDSNREFGVLLDLYSPGIEPCDPLEMSNDVVALYVKKYSNQVFDERGFYLLQALANWYDISGEVNLRKDYYGTVDFENIWEEVCQKIFLDDKSLWVGKMPIGQWNVYSEKVDSVIPMFDVHARSLEPDIVYADTTNNVLFLFDAKYYNPQMSGSRYIGNVPGSSDISKQWLYMYYLKAKYKDYKIVNALLIPKDENDGNWLIEYLGFVNLDTESRLNELAEDETIRVTPGVGSIAIFMINARRAYEEFLIEDNSQSLFNDIVNDLRVRVADNFISGTNINRTYFE